jgi:predicted peptidase
MESTDNVYEATRQVSLALRYRTYLPAGNVENAGRQPLLIYLHGSGECGTDLDLLEKAGLPRHICEGLELSFPVVCPQCVETWDPIELAMLVDRLRERDDVDPSRVYVCGVSLGALGTWQLANEAADRLAAIIAICGPSVRIDVQRFKRLPVMCIHGAMDSVVPIGESVKMVRALRKAGTEVVFRVFADVDHDVYRHCFTDELWDWLEAQVLA